MKIRIDVLHFFQLVNTETALITPNRTDLIVKQIKDYCEEFQEQYNYVQLDISMEEEFFVPTDNNIICLLRELPRKYIPHRNSFFIKTFLPLPKSCCQRKLHLDHRRVN